MVQPKASILGNRTCHVVLNSSAKATLRADRDAEEADAGVGDTVASTTVESSDDEDAAEEEPVVEPEPAPAPTPKKKVVRKKKVTA